MLRRTLAVVLSLALVLALAACGNKQDKTLKAETEGIYIDLGEMKYQVQISRQLNAADPEDSEFLRGVTDTLGPERRLVRGVRARPERVRQDPAARDAVRHHRHPGERVQPGGDRQGLQRLRLRPGVHPGQGPPAERQFGRCADVDRAASSCCSRCPARRSTTARSSSRFTTPTTASRSGPSTSTSSGRVALQPGDRGRRAPPAPPCRRPRRCDEHHADSDPRLARRGERGEPRVGVVRAARRVHAALGAGAWPSSVVAGAGGAHFLVVSSSAVPVLPATTTPGIWAFTPVPPWTTPTIRRRTVCARSSGPRRGWWARRAGCRATRASASARGLRARSPTPRGPSAASSPGRVPGRSRTSRRRGHRRSPPRVGSSSSRPRGCRAAG